MVIDAARMRRFAGMALVVGAAVGMTGCASGLGGDTYSRGEARRAMTVQYGEVDSVRPVRLEGTKSPVGALAGAAVGGIAGSGVRGTRGSAIGTVVGAVAGGLAGAALEEGVTRSQGVEVTVRLENGQVLAVVQDDHGEGLRPGDQVRVIRDGGTTRVTR